MSSVARSRVGVGTIVDARARIAAASLSSVSILSTESWGCRAGRCCNCWGAAVVTGISKLWELYLAWQGFCHPHNSQSAIHVTSTIFLLVLRYAPKGVGISPHVTSTTPQLSRRTRTRGTQIRFRSHLGTYKRALGPPPDNLPLPLPCPSPALYLFETVRTTHCKARSLMSAFNYVFQG